MPSIFRSPNCLEQRKISLFLNRYKETSSTAYHIIKAFNQTLFVTLFMQVKPIHKFVFSYCPQGR